MITTVRLERRKRRWRQQDLGGMVGMTQSQISAIETGDYIPSQEESQRIAAVLGVSCDTLIMSTKEAVRRVVQQLADANGEEREKLLALLSDLMG